MPHSDAEVEAALASDLGPRTPPDLGADVLAEIARAAALPDHWDRVQRLTQLLNETGIVTSHLARLRDESIRELRLAGASLEEIARRTGLSKSRIQQLAGRPRPAGSPVTSPVTSSAASDA